MCKNIIIMVVAFFLFFNNIAYAIVSNDKYDMKNHIIPYSEEECAFYFEDSIQEVYMKIERCVPRLKKNEAYRFSVFDFSEQEWDYLEKQVKKSGKFVMQPFVVNNAGDMIPWNHVSNQLEKCTLDELQIVPYIIIKNK